MGNMYRTKLLCDEPRLPRGEVVKLVAKLTHKSQAECREIMAAYDYVLREAVRIGYVVSIPKMGKFVHSVRRGRQEGDYYSLKYGKMTHWDKIPDFKQPEFLFEGRFARSVRVTSMGHIEALPREWSKYYVIRQSKLVRKKWDEEGNELPEEYFNNDICRKCEEIIGGTDKLGQLNEFDENYFKNFIKLKEGELFNDDDENE
jgi:nucleoid DNA-binding protein